MTSDVTEREGPLVALRRRWWLALSLATIGGVLGALLAAVGGSTVTAETRVAVGTGDLKSESIAGFPLATTQLASNYARYVTDQSLARPGSAQVSASPIPDSNVIRVEAAAPDSTTAVTAVNAATSHLVEQVNSAGQTARSTLLRAYDKALAEWSPAQTAQTTASAVLEGLLSAGQPEGSPQITRAQQALTDAQTRLERVQVLKDAASAAVVTQATSSQGAKLVLVQRAVVGSSDLASNVERLALLGVVAGLAAALVIAAALARRDRRRGAHRAVGAGDGPRSEA